jgi:hypothetical protein
MADPSYEKVPFDRLTVRAEPDPDATGVVPVKVSDDCPPVGGQGSTFVSLKETERFESAPPHPASVHEAPDNVVFTFPLDDRFVVHNPCGSPIHAPEEAVPVKV